MIDYRRLPELFARTFRVEDRFRPNTHVAFKVNSAQRDLLELCAQIQDQKQLVWIIAIKPRRVGLSRVMSGIGTALAYYEMGLQGVVMAQLGSTLTKIMRSYVLMARGLSAFTRVKSDPKFEHLVIGRGKHPSVLTGAKALATGEGRGDAAQFMQLTEAAHYPLLSPFTAMLPLVPQDLNTFIGIESTPNPQRQGIAFREMWDQARWIHEKRRDTLFVRYFCPWFRDPYAIADAKIAKDAPIDEAEKTLLNMKNPVNLAQLAWRRREIRGRYRGKVELFEQENPSDPLSCFNQTETPAFSPEEMAWARESALEWQEKFRQCRIQALTNTSPIKIVPDEEGDWRIYEEPQKNCEYYIGVDTARGIDLLIGDGKKIGDYSAIVIINGSTCAVAAVMESREPPDDVARQVATAGRLYRTIEISEHFYAMLNIAFTDGYGNEVLRRVRDEYNYPITRFTRWRGRDDRIHNRPGIQIGWTDTRDTNQMRLDMLRIALAHRQLHVRDPRLAEQIQAASSTLQGDAEVIRGHDDILDACMYAWVAREFDKPRVVIKVDETETALYRGLVKMANDPQAQARKLWEEVARMGKPTRPNFVDEMVRYINDSRN